MHRSVPDAPLLSAPWPGVVQEPVSEQELVLLHGALPCKVQDFAVVLAEFHQVSVSLFLQVPLSGSPAWEHFDTSSFGVICKCDESVLSCLFPVSDEDAKEDRSQDSPLWYSICYQPPGGVWPVNHYLLSLIGQKRWAKPKGKCSWETVTVILHLRGASLMNTTDMGALVNVGKRFYAILTALVEVIFPFLQETGGELNIS